MVEVQLHSSQLEGVKTHVLFVHGMRGHITQSWMQAGHPDVFWPAWLQEDLARLAVWSVGYSAPATKFGGATMHLPDRASGILAFLAAKPELSSGTILFVTHSLGGLVVKQLLRNAETLAPHNSRIASFFDRVRGVAFLSTPHRGADLGTLGRLFGFLSRATENLPRNHPALRDLNQWYVGFSEKHAISNLLLYETRPTGLFTIVKPDSADAGLPLSSQLIPVDEDHISICKIRDRTSEVYEHLRLFIASVDDSSDAGKGERAREEQLEGQLVHPSAELLGYQINLPDGQHLDRPEAQQLSDIVTERERSISVVLGPPGSGKSALLSEFSRSIRDLGLPVLAIKADLLPATIQNEEELGVYLGLTQLPSVTLERVAATKKVVLVIDQLDALASYLDLRTGRLSVLLNLVRRLAAANNIHIVMSARTFEYEHDVRLRSISAESILLELPPWEIVREVLDAHGYKSDGWRQDTKELLRSPQALATFLRLERSAQPLENYQAMLEKFWEEKVLSLPDGAELARLLADIAQVMAEEECLWIAKVRFEGRTASVNTLVSQGFLYSSRIGADIGFAHQSLFDHAIARNFAREPGQLSKYVLERQASLFVRPKLWASLSYIRAAAPSAYERELQAIWEAQGLRRHLTMLLIDFVGQQSTPTDFEELLISSAMEQAELRPQAFRAISGSPGWFHRLKNTFLLRVMTEGPSVAHLAAGVLISAWDFARSDVMATIEKNWSGNTEYDYSTWHVLSNCSLWSEDGTALAIRVINRTDLAPSVVNHLASQIGADHPSDAIKLIAAKLQRDLDKAKALSAARKGLAPPANEEERFRWYLSNSPTKPLTDLAEDSDEWYSLDALAERAPEQVFSSLWIWFLELLRQIRDFDLEDEDSYEYSINNYLDYRFEEERSRRPSERPILEALQVGVEGLAANDGRQFELWVAENEKTDAEPVHRLIAHAIASQPQRYSSLGLEYVLGDRRRFCLGGSQDRLGTSKRLVVSISPYWSEKEIVRFIDAVIDYSPRPPKSMSTQNRQWFFKFVRRIRLSLLSALPQTRLGDSTRKLIAEERRAFGDDDFIGVRASEARFIGSPMSRSAFSSASDADIINAFREIHDATAWDHPNHRMKGGNVQLSREFAEYARENPERVASLIRMFEPGFGQRGAGYALNAMAEKAEPERIIAVFLDLAGRGFDREEFRTSACSAIERLVERKHPIPDTVVDILIYWLATNECNGGGREKADEDEGDDKDNEANSTIWGNGGLSIVPGGNYPILEAITRVLLERGEHDRLIAILASHLNRNEAPKVWQSLITFLVYLNPADVSAKSRLLEEILRKYPMLLHTHEVARVLAHAHWWDPEMARRILQHWPREDARSGITYGEIVSLVAHCHPDLAWPQEALKRVIDVGVADEQLGVAFTAANLWNEPDHRAFSTAVLLQLMRAADVRIWHAIFQIFRISDELVPDSETTRVLTSIADNVRCAGKVDATFVVERLQSLLPHQALLVARLAKELVSKWKDELGDFRTSTAASAAELVDLAVTLHRLGPDTREFGTRIFEDLLVIDAWGARQTLDQIDNRLRSNPAPPRRRLRRRSRQKKSLRTA